MNQAIFSEGMSLGAVLINGFGVTLLGMGVVFLVLIIISFSLDLLRITLSGGKPPRPSPESAVPRDASERLSIRSEAVGDDTELAAVIASAVAAYTDIPAGDLCIRSVRPLDSLDPTWGRVGRRLQMGQRL